MVTWVIISCALKMWNIWLNTSRHSSKSVFSPHPHHKALLYADKQLLNNAFMSFEFCLVFRGALQPAEVLTTWLDFRSTWDLIKYTWYRDEKHYFSKHSPDYPNMQSGLRMTGMGASEGISGSWLYVVSRKKGVWAITARVKLVIRLNGGQEQRPGIPRYD